MLSYSQTLTIKFYHEQIYVKETEILKCIREFAKEMNMINQMQTLRWHDNIELISRQMQRRTELQQHMLESKEKQIKLSEELKHLNDNFNSFLTSSRINPNNPFYTKNDYDLIVGMNYNALTPYTHRSQLNISEEELNHVVMMEHQYWD